MYRHFPQFFYPWTWLLFLWEMPAVCCRKSCSNFSIPFGDIRDMECLTEDVDVVLAGTKENQKSPHLEWAQWLLVKQPAWFHSNTRHPSHSPKSHSSLAVSLPNTNLDFHRLICKTQSRCRIRLFLCERLIREAEPYLLLCQAGGLIFIMKRGRGGILRLMTAKGT